MNKIEWAKAARDSLVEGDTQKCLNCLDVLLKGLEARAQANRDAVKKYRKMHKPRKRVSKPPKVVFNHDEILKAIGGASA